MNQSVMDRWTTVKRIHQAALDKDPSERAAFLHDSCGIATAMPRRHRCILEHRQRACELLSNGTPELERGNTGLGLVVHYAEVGDLDAAFEHLHRALDARDPALVHLAVAPQWDSLRADPRFNECLARMKLRPVL